MGEVAAVRHEWDEQLHVLQGQVQEREKQLHVLQGQVQERDEQLHVLQGQVQERDEQSQAQMHALLAQLQAARGEALERLGLEELIELERATSSTFNRIQQRRRCKEAARRWEEEEPPVLALVPL